MRALAPLTLATAALLIAVGAGCGERAEPIGATVPIRAVTVQGAGDDPTVIHARPERIAAVGDTPTRMLRSLGVGKLIVGSNLDVLSGPPLVDKIRRLHPDLIVGSSESDSTDLDQASRVTGAPDYIAPDGSVREVERAIDDLGLLTGTGARAREQVAAIQRTQARVAERLAHTRPVKVFVDLGFFATVGYRSLLGDIIRQAGGANVAGANPETGPFDLHELLKLQPRIYLATSDSGTTLGKLRANPQARRLAAVKAKRFEIIPARLVAAGPQVGQGIAAVARLLHPDAFR